MSSTNDGGSGVDFITLSGTGTDLKHASLGRYPLALRFNVGGSCTVQSLQDNTFQLTVVAGEWFSCYVKQVTAVSGLTASDVLVVY